jgi:Flp pilus assembly pilin Flp
MRVEGERRLSVDNHRGEGGEVSGNHVKRLMLDEEGATALEYSLMAAAIAGVIIVVAFLMGGKAFNAINRVAVHIN